MDRSLSQYLIVGLGGFGGSVIDRVKALPIERNIVYHRLEVEGGKPVAEAYVPYRERLLGVLNREVFNFANTPLTVYLVGLLVEEHMASNLMHLGYLFKSFFRENIILSPRVKVLTAFPTIIPEDAYAWLPQTRKVLAEIDGYASLKDPFQPRYPDLKRSLPSISGPPFEDVVFCYCESLDEDDMEALRRRRRRPRSISISFCCRSGSARARVSWSSTGAFPRARGSLRSRERRSPFFPPSSRWCATRWNTS